MPSNDKVAKHKHNAIKQIESMHLAISAGDYKKAINHQKAAEVAIDDMVATSGMVEKKRKTSI